MDVFRDDGELPRIIGHTADNCIGRFTKTLAQPSHFAFVPVQRGDDFPLRRLNENNPVHL